jgi:hypothetical protein
MPTDPTPVAANPTVAGEDASEPEPDPVYILLPMDIRDPKRSVATSSG